MSAYQARSCRFPNLRITVKHETEERSVKEAYPNRRAYRPTAVYYNSNHRQKQYFNQPPTVQRRPPKYDRFHQQPIRPLMEIPDNQFSVPHEPSYSFKPREPKQRGQYRNRKAELDWDHAFDLDQIDLYTAQHDIDNYSLASLNSSSDNSFSSV